MIMVSVENDHECVREKGTSLCMCHLSGCECERERDASSLWMHCVTQWL